MEQMTKRQAIARAVKRVGKRLHKTTMLLRVVKRRGDADLMDHLEAKIEKANAELDALEDAFELVEVAPRVLQFLEGQERNYRATINAANAANRDADELIMARHTEASQLVKVLTRAVGKDRR